MSTSTILRVKRRLEENPQDAFVFMCKRMKTSEKEELSPSVFVFQGTIKDQKNTDLHVKKIWSNTDTEVLKTQSSKNITDIVNKLRKERQENANESRYEIVNCSRGIKDELKEDDAAELSYSLVDLERTQKEDEDRQNVEYAYDLYISQKQDFDVSMLDNVVRIENYEADVLTFGSFRDNYLRTPSLQGSDDSNDEDNWRNEYPDTDHSSIDEEDIRQAVQNCEIVDNLSSDSGEDNIYNDPVTAEINSENLECYGLSIAKNKAEVLANKTDITDKKNLVYCTQVKDLDEESIEGYKADSDDGFYYGEEEDTEHFQEQYKHDESSDDYPD